LAAPSMLEKPISADETTTGAEQTAATVERKISADAQTATRQPAFATAMSSEVPASLTGAATPTATPAAAKTGATGPATAKGAAVKAGPAAAKAPTLAPTGEVAAAPAEAAEAVSAEPADAPGPPTGGAGAAQKPVKPKVRTSATDPRFQKVMTRLDKSAARTKKHPPAAKKAAEAKAAAEPPKNEKMAAAKEHQVSAMQETETKKPDQNSFLNELLTAIKRAIPQKVGDTETFMQGEQRQQVQNTMSGSLNKQKAQATGDLKATAEKEPDPKGVEGKEATPLPSDKPATPPAIGASDAIPEPRDDSEVSLQQGKQEADDKLKEAQVTPEQLKKANDPRFTAVLTAKSDVDQHADTAPQKYRADEHKTLTQEAIKAASDEKNGLTALQNVHDKSGAAVKQHQLTAKGQDEARRKEVTDHIESIYNETKQAVEQKLRDLETKVTTAFDDGVNGALARMKKYINDRYDERYSGFFGFLDKIGDYFDPLPPDVQAFYDQGRDLFMEELNHVVANIATIVDAQLGEAKNEIAKGQQRIRDFVLTLHGDLRAVGQAAERAVASRFDELRQSVDDKKHDLVQKLAQRYKEACDKADEELKKIQDEHKSFIVKLAEKLAEVVKILADFKDRITNMFKAGIDTILLIVAHPIDFLMHLIDAIKLGVNQFVDNIWTHLKEGFMAWLFGTLEDAGIEIPKDLSLGSLFKLVLQILGITYPKMRAKAVKYLGERNVAIIEQVGQFLYTLITGGPDALWEQVKEFLGNLKEMVLDALQNWIVTTIIKEAVIKLLSLFFPVSAIIEAIKGIYHTVTFFIERINQILAFVESIINSVHKIAVGDIVDAANWIEKALAKTIPIIISFLAELIGLGGLSDKIRETVTKIQTYVDKAIDALIEKAIKWVKSLFGKGKEEKPDDRTPEQKEADLHKGVAEAEALLEDEKKAPEQVKKELPAIKSKYKMTSLELVTDSESGSEETDHIEGEINPKEKGKEVKKKHSKEKRYLPKDFDVRYYLYEKGSGFSTIKKAIKQDALGKIIEKIEMMRSATTSEEQKQRIWDKLVKAGQVPDDADRKTYTVEKVVKADYDVDHKRSLARHWNEVGFNSSDVARQDIAGSPENLQLLLSSVNRSKGGEGYHYVDKPYIGQRFSSETNNCPTDSLTIGSPGESFLDENQKPLK
jgi:hypothetical protein